MAHKKFTGFRSIVYRSGMIYNWVTQRLFDQEKKFLTIATLIGNNSKKVLDLPCGTGFLIKYLHPTTQYTGYDLNHRFLKKIKRNWLRGRVQLKKLVLKQQNIFDFDKYPKEKQDVIVLCDILHHVYPKHIELVENAKKHAKKIIVCEPIHSINNFEEMNSRDFLGKTTIFITKFFPESVIKVLDFFLVDNDGINNFDNRAGWQHDEESLKELYNSMGFNKTYNLMDDCIGIWEN